MADGASAILDLCLVAGRRANSGQDCPIAAFAADACHARADPVLHQAFAAGLSRVLGCISTTDQAARDRIPVALAAAVGTAVMARAAGIDVAANRILGGPSDLAQDLIRSA